jgi:ubiquinone/menaquinone biosynthesis C-methylase UbiE
VQVGQPGLADAVEIAHGLPSEAAAAVLASQMSQHEHWQLDGSAPELYERYLVPAITLKWATDLVDRAMPAPGETLLDIACGTGVVARLAAQRMRSGSVVGLDINPGMLTVARSRSNSGATITWLEGSALSLPFDDRSFGLVLCQLGLQFFPDRPLALREMKRVLAPSGRLALSVYSAIENTPGAHAFATALDDCLGSGASSVKRAEHIFSAADELGSEISEGGFQEVAVETVSKRVTFPSVLDYVRFQLIATPMAGLLKDHTEVDRESIIEKVASVTQSLLSSEMFRDDHFSFPQEAYVATALRTGRVR